MKSKEERAQEVAKYQEDMRNGRWGWCKECGDPLHKAEQKRGMCNLCLKWSGGR
jgi:RNA polymerase-binding transcription factor DksA